MKPFPSLPTGLGNRTCSDFTHSHRTDDYFLLEGPILTFLSGAHRDIPIGRQHQDQPSWGAASPHQNLATTYRALQAEGLCHGS